MKYDVIEVEITNSKVDEEEYKKNGWKLHSVRMEGEHIYVVFRKAKQ